MARRSNVASSRQPLSHIRDSCWCFREKWGSRVDIRLVFIVPNHFPGPAEVFPVRSNGIRYGIFALEDVVAAANKLPSASDGSKELLKIIQLVRENKDDRDQGYSSLTSWTAGRANFRVCPSTKYDSGVDEDLFRRTRILQKSERKELVKDEVDDE